MNDITSERTYRLRLALDNLSEIGDQNDRIHAVASAGIAFCNQSSFTEAKLFQVIQNMVESTVLTNEVRTILEQAILQIEVQS